MTVEGLVALYHDAWRSRRGDFSDVPLAEDSDQRCRLWEMAGQASQASTWKWRDRARRADLDAEALRRAMTHARA